MLRHTYQPRFVRLQTAHGSVRALTFVVDPTCQPYVAGLTLDQAAHYVATVGGIYGSSFEYVDNLAAHLRGLGIADPTVTDLHERARQLMRTD